MKILDIIKEMESVKQTKYSFDKQTIVKILKGALIAGTGAAALFILDAISTIKFTNTGVAALVAFLVPFLINVIKEWLKGSK